MISGWSRQNCLVLRDADPESSQVIIAAVAENPVPTQHDQFNLKVGTDESEYCSFHQQTLTSMNLKNISSTVLLSTRINTNYKHYLIFLTLSKYECRFSLLPIYALSSAHVRRRNHDINDRSNQIINLLNIISYLNHFSHPHHPTWKATLQCCAPISLIPLCYNC